MDLTCYPYDFEYKIKQGKVCMYLYSILEDGTKVCLIHEHQPYFFASVRKDQTDLLTKINLLRIPTRDEPATVLATEFVEKEFLGKKKTFLKIIVNYPKAVPFLAKELESLGLDCYEKDILFVHRYLRDANITPMALVQTSGEFVPDKTMRVPVFKVEKIVQATQQTSQKWKILAVDIETYAERKEIDPEKNPILMIAVYGLQHDGSEFKKVLTWKKFPHDFDYVESVADEREMLQRFRDIVVEFQPEIITGYFSDGFDFPYIKTRAERYRLKLDLGLDHSELQIRAGTGFRSSEAKINGLLHLDMLKFIKHIFGMNLKTDSYSLNAVSAELLGHRKHDVNLDNLARIWDNQPEKLPEFCAYNLHDAHLTFKLCAKLLPDIIEFTKIVGVPSYDLIRMRFSRLVENYILKRAMEFNVLAPNKPVGSEMEQRMEEHIQGAFVYEPTPGLYKDVVVFDFRSLYPTIISAHNIGPEALCCSCCQEKAHVPEREDSWFCAEKKFIPSVLEQLILRRVDLKRLIKEQKNKKDKKDQEEATMLEARSYALKILANSFYGYLGFFGARWYCLECAASTTAYARSYIKKTITAAEETGFRVVYSDTDSCFMLLGDKQLDEAMAFMNEINSSLPGHMELEFEGYFPRGIFVAIKGSEKGAKKKYALIRKDGSMKITGFETVRRNSSLLAKEAQENVLRLVLQDNKEAALVYIRQAITSLKEGKVPLPQLIIKTQITRELHRYTSIGPHVLVAQKLAERGETVNPGTTVEYIIAKGSGLVRERAKLAAELREGDYDAEYYLHHQLLPAVSSIFAVLGYSEEGILRKGKQVGLGEFM